MDITLGAGWAKLAENLAEFPKHVKASQKAMLDQATLIGVSRSKEVAPVDKNTLRGSLTRSVDENAGTGRWGTNVKYARYQEYGTGIRSVFGGSMIVPKVAPALRFKDKYGRWHSAKQVAGVFPRYFMKGGLDMVRAKIDLILRAGSEAVFRNMVK